MRGFPWHALSKVGRAQAHAMRSLRVRLRSSTLLDPHGLARALQQVLGLPAKVLGIEIRYMPEVLPWMSSAPLPSTLHGLRGPITVLALDELVAAVEVDAELAVGLVEFLATHNGLRSFAPLRSRQVDPEVAGALASILCATLHAAQVPTAVLALDLDSQEVGRFVAGNQIIVSLTLSFLLPDGSTLVGSLRVVTKVPSVMRQVHLTSQRVLYGLGNLLRTLEVVTVWDMMPLQDVASLRLGDMLMFQPRINRTNILLATALATDGVLATLSIDKSGDSSRDLRSRTTVRINKVSQPLEMLQLAVEPIDSTSRSADLSLPQSQKHRQENAMRDEGATAATMELSPLEDGEQPQALHNVLADAPVLIRVEIGSITLTAAEWAQIGPEDVLALDRRIGDLVTVRVSGQEIARGELVDVEGAIGVRIVEKR